MKPPPPSVVRYGDHPDQVANLHLPAPGDVPRPVVVLVHGGFWRDRWDRTLMTPLACDLAARGVAAWNVEYRRVDQEGGGWPGTLHDMAAAMDILADIAEISPRSVVVVGHSAGGHLALWAAARHRLPPGVPGTSPRVRPVGVVAQAGVCDLARAALDALGGGAVEAFMGGPPEQVPDRYAAASAAALLPLGVNQLLVHGTRDDIVPLSQSHGYAEAARKAGDPVHVIEADADHFDVIDPAHEAWVAVIERLPRLAGHGAAESRMSD
jgi:acetyl esterase/lipase